MQPIEHRPSANITPHGNGHLVQISDKTYYLTELQFTGASQLVTPHPIAPQPTATDSDPQFTFWLKILALATLGLGALFALVVLRELLFRPPPIPIAAPASPPQPIIVQAPQPEKRPYRRRQCRPAGLFGWGSDCLEEQGYE